MEDLLKQFSAPFPAHAVKWRVGNVSGQRGLALAYLDARDVMRRFDEVMGLYWQCRYTHVSPIIVCEIGIRHGSEWIWRANGAGETDFEAEKGGASDAFKRAAVLWGVGRYLYGLPSPWVDLVNGRIPRETQEDLTERLRVWQERMQANEIQR